MNDKIARGIINIALVSLVVSTVSYFFGYKDGQRRYDMTIHYKQILLEVPQQYPDGQGTIFTEMITDTFYVAVDTVFKHSNARY
jgi:hypothetical protein